MSIKKSYTNKKQLSKLNKEVSNYINRTGQTKKQIAYDLSISPSALGNFLSGRSKLTEARGIQICQEIGIVPTVVYGELAGSLQVHFHRHKLTAPIETESRTIYMENPGAWEIVEIDKAIDIKGDYFRIQAKKGSSLIIVGLPLHSESNITTEYVAYAETEHSDFEIITKREFDKKPKGYKALGVAAFSWGRL